MLNWDVNFSSKIFCVSIVLNQDTRRIVKTILDITIVKGITLSYQKQNRSSYNDGVSRNHQHDGESQENINENTVDEKLTCLVKSNTSKVLQTAHSMASDKYQHKFLRLKIYWILDLYTRKRRLD